MARRSTHSRIKKRQTRIIVEVFFTDVIPIEQSASVDFVIMTSAVCSADFYINPNPFASFTDRHILDFHRIIGPARTGWDGGGGPQS